MAGRGRRWSPRRAAATCSTSSTRRSSRSPPRSTPSSTSCTGPATSSSRATRTRPSGRPSRGRQVARELARAHVTGPYRTLAQDVSFGMDQLVEICIRALSPAVNDTFTALTCIDWIGDSLYKVTGRWQPTRVYRDGAGDGPGDRHRDHLGAAGPARFEKVRQAGRGMPAVLIRQLDALARIMERTTTEEERQVLAGSGRHDRAASEPRSMRRPTAPTSAAPTRQVLDRARRACIAPAAARSEGRRARRRAGRAGTAAGRQQHCRPDAEHREALPGAEQLTPIA